MTGKKSVTLVEVGPRDGLQNEPDFVPTATKIDFINQLSLTGLKKIEATSFVSPKWVPQMADHAEVMQAITRNPAVSYAALVPNQQGLENALKTKPDEIAVFTAASETFSQKNTHCSIAESLERIQTVVNAAQAENIPVRAYISCVLGCPYEGNIITQHVTELAKQLHEMGCYQISLGDTIGIGTANQAAQLIREVAQAVPLENIAIHFHDTYGQALANIYACLELGITTIDSSVAGLGGCPYAPGASGNVATEDVVYLLNGLGIDTGIDLDALINVGQTICQRIKRPYRSKVGQAYTLA